MDCWVADDDALSMVSVSRSVFLDGSHTTYRSVNFSTRVGLTKVGTNSLSVLVSTGSGSRTN